MKPIFIAEIKTQSPFGYRSELPFISLMNLAITYGDWVSVHTNALWGGDFQTLSFVRAHTNKPILAKGIHNRLADIAAALDHGADYVLTVTDSLNQVHNLNNDTRKRCLFETKNTLENREIVKEFPDIKVVYNSRDLSTGLPKKKDEFADYVTAFPWVCQASGIVAPYLVRPRADAFIVGEHLAKFVRAL
jgi:indole-3-glycerol phosphate synthase